MRGFFFIRQIQFGLLERIEFGVDRSKRFRHLLEVFLEFVNAFSGTSSASVVIVALLGLQGLGAVISRMVLSNALIASHALRDVPGSKCRIPGSNPSQAEWPCEQSNQWNGRRTCWVLVGSGVIGLDGVGKRSLGGMVGKKRSRFPGWRKRSIGGVGKKRSQCPGRRKKSLGGVLGRDQSCSLLMLSLRLS
jgi:hypothetical protein